MYTVESFSVVNSSLILVIVGISQPTQVLFTLNTGSTVIMVTPTNIDLSTYTYELSVASSDGIFQAAVLDPVGDTYTYTIADLSKGSSYLLNKVLVEDYDCLLHQEMHAVLLYVKSNDIIKATAVYNKVLRKSVRCTTVSTKEEVFHLVWIANDIYI